GSDFLECDLSRRHGLFDHSHVKEERFRALPGKDAHTRTLRAVLVVCVERHCLTAWGQAASALRRTCRAVRSARNVESEVERDLFSVNGEGGGAGSGRGNARAAQAKSINNRIGKHGGRARLAEHIHREDKTLWVSRRGKCKHVGYVRRRVRERPRS